MRSIEEIEALLALHGLSLYFNSNRTAFIRNGARIILGANGRSAVHAANRVYKIWLKSN